MNKKLLISGVVLGGAVMVTGAIIGVRKIIKNKREEFDNLDLAITIGTFLNELDDMDFLIYTEIDKYCSLAELKALKDKCNESEKDYTKKDIAKMKKLCTAINTLLILLKEKDAEVEKSEDRSVITKEFLESIRKNIEDISNNLEIVKEII